jgi:hypothetical protein
MMRKQLLILSAAILFSVIACNSRPDNAGSASEGPTAGGGSVAHMDSIKKIGSGATGNMPGAVDTTKPTNSIAFPADSAKQKKP